MGKKDKKKNKISGSEKTAMKTEKKLNSKQKKEIAKLGEEDIEKVVSEIEREEARRNKVVEATVSAPSRRVNFTLSSHPYKDELIMFGGEFYDGHKTTVYGDLFFYNIVKNEWSVVKAPGGPPPRCSHQAVALPSNKGELWIFGGEYSSPSESQFYHYRDLWCYHIGEKRWEKITVSGGPSARSGHRMIALKKCLFIFGGFHDNLRDYKYYNDIHCFNMSTYTWDKLQILGIPPAPRSGCVVLPTPENKILVYGGYSKEKVKKDVDKGQVHTDMFLLTPEKHDESGLKWKWNSVKQNGIYLSPRCSTSAVLISQTTAYIFGGVFDNEDNEEELHGTFYNDLVGLNLSKTQWYTVTLAEKNESPANVRRRRRNKGEEQGENNEDILEENAMQTNSEMPIMTHNDGVFTMVVGPAPTVHTITDNKSTTESNVFCPSPRINSGLAVKNSTLYLFGGIIEIGDKQYTLSDFYKLDCKKLDGWVTIIKDDLSSQQWLDSSSESGSDDNSDSEESEDNEMEISE